MKKKEHLHQAFILESDSDATVARGHTWMPHASVWIGQIMRRASRVTSTINLVYGRARKAGIPYHLGTINELWNIVY